ncbi:hypothetical protein [Aurantimonas sp. VKM B-3413]|uniref:hypothetical protein n=1 Tax=Aurantimonas sp. VKM B-3413 TaxID=2779401 RepID=UPI00351D3174
MLTFDEAVVDHIVSRCSDPDSGGRMIDNIVTNALLPDLSRRFLTKLLAGEAVVSAHVRIDGGDFAYEIV